VKRYLFFYLMIYSSILIFPALSFGETTPKEFSRVEENKAETTPVDVSKVETRTREWGVALGLRSTYFHLTNPNHHIVGHLTRLEEDQNIIPYKPMLQVDFSKYLAFEFGYDQFKAIALNEPDYDKYWSDGNLEWGTYMLGVHFRWPHFHPSIVPYVLGGFTYNKVSFKENNWYHYGFSSLASYSEWVGQGNRMEDYTDYRRIIKAEDSWGVILGLGVDYFIWKNLALNFDLKYHWIQSNLTFNLADTGGIFREEKGSFNMDSWIFGLGIKYFF
jgi:opacity protein-like surface antigen